MNIYKEKRNLFFNKYFSYPKKLKKAIEYSTTEKILVYSVCEVDIYSVKKIDNTNELSRLLNKSNFYRSFFWAYVYEQYHIYDFASIYWKKNKGLNIHFRGGGIEDIYGNCNIDMDNNCQDFFFFKREVILRNFYPDFFKNYFKVERFHKRLTDYNLNLIDPKKPQIKR